MSLQSIGPYQFTKYIASGTFGVVYECVNVLNGKEYACKVISLEIRNDSKLFENFKNELRIHAKMAHPGIIRCYDVLCDELYIYLILELCKGGTLEQLVQQNGTLDEQETMVYFKEIMESVKYIHACGVAHRDITLKNILIGNEGYAKLSDFGLCKQQPTNSYLTTTCGTFVYVPPEILMEKQYDGFKADIWSAGITLYAMSVNHLPWLVDDSTPPELVWQETQRQICNGEIIYDDTMSPQLCDLLKQMLSVDPEDRPYAEEILSHPWLDAVQDIILPDVPDPDQNLISLVESLIEGLGGQT